MRVYLCLPLSGITCNWLYAFTYAYNLAWGGLKNGKNGGEPNGFCLVFVVKSKIVEICGNLRKIAPLSLLYSGRFSFINSAMFIHSPYQTGSQPMSGR